MAKGMFIGVESKARKIKKSFIGIDDKARKIKKMYIGDASGKARLFWSADNGGHIVCGFVYGSKINKFLILNAYNDADNPITIDTPNGEYVSTSSSSTMTCGRCWDKSFFADSSTTSSSLIWFEDNVPKINTLNSANTMSTKFTLNNSDSKLYGLSVKSNTSNSSTSSTYGSYTLSLAKMGTDLVPTFDAFTHDSYDWYNTSSNDAVQNQNYYFSNVAVYNNKAYYVNTYYQYGSDSNGNGLSLKAYLTGVDLSTGDKLTRTQVHPTSNATATFTNVQTTWSQDLYSFPSGLLAIIHGYIYKLSSTSGTAMSQLKCVYSSGTSPIRGGVIRIDETTFIVHPGDVSSATVGVYKFENGALTQLKTYTTSTTSSVRKYLVNCTVVDGVLVCIHTKSSTTTMLYSLDYGETWTSVVLDTDYSQTSSTITYQKIAGEIY